ncbi:MAG: site-specific integrase [Euryarchaeota archaeon]|nr:site-specific integrase [Euryarchaeota archaeon]
MASVVRLCSRSSPPFDTGLRRGELLQLPRRLCSDNEIEVRHSPAEGLTTKTGKTRFIPLNESARKALRTLLRDEPFKDRLVHKHTEDSLSRAFTVDRIASGVTTKGSLKHLRKTFISNLVNGAGVSLHTAMELAGHTQMKTTQLYLVGTDDQRRKAVDALESLG